MKHMLMDRKQQMDNMDDLHNIPPPPVVGKGIKRCAFGPIQLLKVSN